MNIKTYNFSYGSVFKKFISKTVSFLYNTLVGVFVLLIFAFIFSGINYRLKGFIDENYLDIIRRIEVYSFVIAYIGVFIFPSFLKQKVDVSDNMIKIQRNCLFFSVFMIFRGFNDIILISKITDIHRPIKKDAYMQPIPVGIIDWDNLVIIETESSYYYAPVENSKLFITDVTERVNEYRRKNGLEEI